MKPLLEKDLVNFLERFDNFKDGEFRSIEILSPTNISITLAGQDKARGFDWLSMKLEIVGVADAKLLDKSKLSHIDMDDGISIIKEDDKFAFSIGSSYNISNTKNSICYVLGSTLKYEEGAF